MSKTTRNKLSVLAWSGTVFCAFWLLLSAQAAVMHVKQRPGHTTTQQEPAWTVKAVVPDASN